jgi:hypothetical protein
MTRFGLPGPHTHHAVGTTDALLSGQYEVCLGSRMRMHAGNASRRTAGFVDPKNL